MVLKDTIRKIGKKSGIYEGGRPCGPFLAKTVNWLVSRRNPPHAVYFCELYTEDSHALPGFAA